ncbi:hypothetical protein IEQ34_005622 [Dendrobium chrysotoxum]|uniref:Uncharacterized protein n=1 Tax=Dendrobium chrysotoxum TaxID=161865 RepID=A0AAV7HBN0_DENCH|nr:hypothetical protein IEQ34_005622 [Dendrobium chrysotoxum]
MCIPFLVPIEANIQRELSVIDRDHVVAPISFPDWRTKGMEPFKKKMLAEVEERDAINAANAKKQTCPHTMGRVSSVRRQQEMAIKDRLLLWRINRLHKDGTWLSEDAKQRWIQAYELLAEDGLTPEDGNVEANERVFNIVMGPEHPGRVRTQGLNRYYNCISTPTVKELPQNVFVAHCNYSGHAAVS